MSLVHSRDTDEEIDHAVLVEQEPPEPAVPALRPVPDVSSEQYADARDQLLKLPDFGEVLLEQAAGELTAEGWSDAPPYSVLVVRAAEIAIRPAPRSA